MYISIRNRTTSSTIRDSGTSDLESSQNHEHLLFTNCTRRSCDFLFIVHSTKLRRFHGNLIGTPTEYNLVLIYTALDQSKLSYFVECTVNKKIQVERGIFYGLPRESVA